VPAVDRGPAEQPGFIRQVLGDEADHAALQAARKAARKPWWLPPSQVRHYYRFAGAYLVLAGVALIGSFFIGYSAVVARMFAGLWLAMSAWHLVSAVVLRRRARRG
jgi:hypothetical protein